MLKHPAPCTILRKTSLTNALFLPVIPHGFTRIFLLQNLHIFPINRVAAAASPIDFNGAECERKGQLDILVRLTHIRMECNTLSEKLLSLTPLQY